MRKKFLLIISILLVTITTYAYSALSTQLAITSDVKMRPLADIRVNGIVIDSASGATMQYESEYTKNTISSGFILPTTSARISYSVHIDNTGDYDYAIYDLTNTSTNNSGLQVNITSGYTMRDVIPAKTSLDVIVTYNTTTPSANPINVISFFNFKKVYHVSYVTGTSQTIAEQLKYEDVDLVLSNTEPTKNGYTFTKWNTKQDGTGVNYLKGATYTPNETATLYAQFSVNNISLANQTLNNGTYGTAYTSNAFNPATNGTGNYTYTIQSGAPTGATINSTNRTISFPATTPAGTYKVVVKATDSTISKNATGTMTITINPKALTLTAGSTSRKYNGQPLTNSTCTAGTGQLLSGHTVTCTMTGASTVTNVADSPKTNTISTYTIIDANSNDVTANYNVTTQTGTLTVTKADATCTINTTPTLTYPGAATGNITYTCTGDGARSVTSSDTTAITVGTVGTTSTSLTAKKVGSATISVSQAAGSNYNAASVKTATINVTASSYTVTANANGGSIPSTTGWTGTGATATKSVTYGSTYGTLPTPTKTGYTFKGWVGKNLFDMDASPYRASYYIKGDGTTISLAEYGIYQVSIEPNTIYTITNSGGSTSPGYVIYNSSGTRVAGENYANRVTITFTTPSDASYIRFSVVTQASSSRYDKNKFQLEKGTAATAYESHYITEDTIVTTAGNHTITADWTPANYTATYLSDNLLKGYTLENSGADSLVKSSDTSYSMTVSSSYSGARISPSVLTVGKTYVLTYDVQKTSGTFVNIGGHDQAATEREFTIDGVDSSNSYYRPASNMSSKNDTEVHRIWFKFTYNGGASENGIYIQPNRGNTSSLSLDITNLALYEVVEDRTVTYNSPYGEHPSVSRTGYTLDGWSLLPQGYTQVEYIQSNGNQYLDTGIYPSTDLSVELDMALVNAGGDQKFFGSYSNSGGVCLGTLSNKWRYGSSTWHYNNVSTTTDRTYITISGKTYTFNDFVQTRTDGTNAITNNNQHTILLFGIAFNGSVLQKDSIKVYGLKMYQNGEISRNFIPCINDSIGKAGLYDLVTGEFYGNSGTGDFIYGSTDYITPSTLVTTPNDHNVYSHWTSSDISFNGKTLNNATYGTAYTSNAFDPATNGTGSYTYTIVSGAPTGATINSTNRTISFPATTLPGTYNVVVKATDDGTGNSANATMNITVNTRTVTLTAGTSSRAWNGNALTNGTCTAGTGQLISGHTVTCAMTVASTITTAGSVANTISTYVIKDGSNNDVTSRYNVTTATGTLTITLATPTVSLTAKSAAYTGNPIPANAAIVTPDSNPTITYTYYSGTSCSGTGTTTAPTSAGDYRVIAHAAAVSGKTTAADSACTAHTITKVAATLTCSNKQYNGTEQTGCTCTGGTIGGDYKATNYSSTGYTATCTGDNDHTSPASQTWSITKKPLTLTAGSTSRAYDGTVLTDSSCTGNALVSGHSATCTMTSGSTVTNVADSPVANTISTYTIKDASNNNVTANYNVTTVAGTLTLTKRDITITAGSTSRAYNGTALTNSTCTGGTGQLADGHTLACTMTSGSTVTNVADSPKTNTISTYTIKSGSTDVAPNYNVTLATGTLTVTKATCPVPTNLAIATDKKVSWTNNSIVNGYQISMNASSGFAAHTNNTAYDAITDSTGTRTVYLRSVCDTANFTSANSSNASASTTVYSVSLTAGTGISAVSGAGNYITGASTSIDATVKTGYTWTNWTGTSTITTKSTSVTVNGTKTYTANATANSYTVTANANGGSIASTTGWTGTGNTATKSVTYNAAYGTLPTVAREGYTLAGWSLVPDGYTQIEYIESTNTQYINTGAQIFNKASHEIIMDFEPTQFYNFNQLFGSTTDGDTFESWIYSAGSLAGRYNTVRYGSDNTLTVNTRYLVDFVKNDTKLSKYVNGTLIGTGTANTSTATGTMTLFKSGSDYSRFKLYSAKIYANGEIVRDFVPCINNSTGKAGLYDVVNGVFYGNDATSGNDFTVGSAEYITSSTVVNEARNHTIYAKWEGITYYVAFDGNGNTSGTMANQEFKYGQAQNLTSNGYAKSYTVTYAANGGSVSPTAANTTATYTFGGWLMNGEGSIIANEASVNNLTTDADVVIPFEAQWKGDGNVVGATKSITTPTPTRTGATFIGWKLTADDGLAEDEELPSVIYPAGATVPLESNITLTALWEDQTAPTAPAATVTSGTLGPNGYYTTGVTVKVTAGTDSGTGVKNTTYQIGSGTETQIANNGTFTLSEDGTYVITVRTYDKAKDVPNTTWQPREENNVTESTITIRIKTKSNFNYSFNTMNNINNWNFLEEEAFDISYDALEGLSEIKFDNRTGWEIAYIPVDTVANASYKLRFDYFNLQAYTASSGYTGIGIQALTQVKPNDDNTTNALKTEYLPTAVSAGVQTKEFTFTATSTKTYIALNFGMLNSNAKIRIGNFRFVKNETYGTPLTNSPGFTSAEKPSHGLPAGYTEVEYIESSGTQYINTGVTANNNVNFDIVFNTSDPFGSSTYGAIFGSRPSSGTNDFQLTTYTGSGYQNGTFRYGTNKNQSAQLKSESRTRATLKNGIYYVDGVQIASLSISTFSNSNNIYIFALNNANSPTQYGKLKLYSFDLTVSGTLTRRFVPCINDSTGKAGLYDVVGKTFYGNSGSGNFTYGNLSDDYTFNGWYSEPTGGTILPANPTMPDNDTTYYAQFDGNKYYNVTYDSNYVRGDIYGSSSVNSALYLGSGTSISSRNIGYNTNAKEQLQVELTMGSGSSNGAYFNTSGMTLQADTVYTWSVFLKASSNKTLLVGSEQNGTKKVDVTTEWQRFTYTFTANNNSSKNFIFYLTDGSTWTAGEQLYIHSLEIGNIPNVYNGAQWSDESNIKFDGSNDYVILGKNDIPRGTIETTFSIDTIKSDTTVILANTEGGGFQIALDGSGNIFSYTYIAGSYRRQDAGKVAVGVKYTAAVTYDGSSLKTYLNGVLKATTSVSGTIGSPTSNTVWMLGAQPNAHNPEGQYLNGKVYSAKAYNRALTADEIFRNYNFSNEFSDEGYVIDGLFLNFSPQKNIGNSIPKNVTIKQALTEIGTLPQVPTSGNLFQNDLVASGVTLSRSGNTYTYTDSGNAANNGAYISASKFTEGHKYLLSYNYQKVSGTLNSPGGHLSGSTENQFLIDGSNARSTYSGTNFSATANDTKMHTTDLIFTYHADGSNNNVYIQINKNSSTAITAKISDIQLYDITDMDSNITVADIPVRNGYTFQGWYTQPVGGAEVTPSTKMPSENTTYYAQWVSNTSSRDFAKVTFVRNSTPTDTEQSSVTYVSGISGQTFTSNNWSKVGHSLIGWSTTRDATTAEFAPNYAVSDSWIESHTGQNVTLYAVWGIETYTITLSGNGATSSGTGTIYSTYNTAIYLDSAKTKVMTTSANPVTKPGRAHTVYYSAAGGSSCSSTTATYTFKGFYTATSGGVQMINASGYITSNFTPESITSDTTLYAQWTSSSVTLPSTSRTGYNFQGWKIGTSTYSAGSTYTPTSNQTATAQWSAKSYRITFYQNGPGAQNSTSTRTLYYGNSLPTIWSTAKSTSGATHNFQYWRTSSSGGTRKNTVDGTTKLYAYYGF